jgi:hypothetical protein
MGRRVVPAALLTVLVSGSHLLAQPGGGIFSAGGPGMGGAFYAQLSAAPTSETTAGPSSTTFGPTGGINQLALNWWFYRVQGDTRERPFGTYTKSDGFNITGTSNWPPGGAGQTSTYNWTESGSAGTRFAAKLTSNIAGGAPYQGQLSQSFQITNPSSSPLTMSLFNLVYWPLSDNPSNPVIATGNINSITVTDGIYQETHTAVAAAAFQAAKDQALINLLTDAPVNNLNNSGLPYSDNRFTDAFQWDLVIPANGSVTIESDLSSMHAVPEPSGFFLTGIAVAAAACWFHSRTKILATQEVIPCFSALLSLHWSLSRRQAT